jgi:DNA-directed RNA polymerase subunit RPC12/RpoP
MNETLMVSCHQCGRAFPTALQVDRATLEALVLTKVYECPHCGEASPYVKSDHFHHLNITESPPS